MTALQDPAARSRGLELGADDVLTKPLDPGELRLRLRNLLRLRQERLALQRSHARVVELQRFKDEMAALLVHDLRNPASAVLANLQYLLGVETPPDHAEALGDTHEACRRMLRLLENLRDVARAEDSHLAPTTAWVEPSTVFEAIIAQRESTCRARGVRLLVDMEPSGRTPIDQDLVTRIIENVFDNAVRYTPRGGTISLATKVVGGTLQVRVGNSGAAIPLADRKTVFEKYECLAHARTRKPDGGLGLYFCRLAAEAHGGSIWVEEEPGLPTVFVLALPMNDVGAERSRAAR